MWLSCDWLILGFILFSLNRSLFPASSFDSFLIQILFFLLFLCKLFFLLIFLVNQQFFFSLIFSSCYSQIDSKIFFGILISHGIIFFIPVSVLFSVEFFESLPLLRFICRLFFYKLRFSIFLFFTGFAFHLSVNSFSI